MKILFFNWRDITHPYAGGAERYIHEIGKRLSEKHEVTLWCGKYKGCKDVEEMDGIRVVRSGSSNIRIGVHDPTIYALAGWNYFSKLRKEGFDIVIENIIGLPFFTPLFAKVPKVAILHHLVRRIVFKEVPSPVAAVPYLGEGTIPWIYRNVQFITISESSKKEMIELGIAPSKIAIVYVGVDRTLFSEKHRKSDFPHVIYLGRMKKYKRLDLLIRAMETVTKEIPDAKLTIAGSGDAQRGLMALVDRLGLKDSVIFRGYVDEKEKARLLGSAWLFVSPSSMEGWGISVMEANASGTPCIAFDVPGLRDSIKNGETGVLVKQDGNVEILAGSIIRVLRDDELRKKLSKNAMKWAKNFDWDKSAKQFAKIIENAVGFD